MNRKPAPRAPKLYARPFGSVVTEFLKHHGVPSEFNFKVRNRAQKRAQDPRTQVALPAVNRNTAPLLEDGATAQDAIRAFKAFLASAGWEDPLTVRLVRVRGSGKFAGPKDINGHTKLATLHERVEAMGQEVEDLELSFYAGAAVEELLEHHSEPSTLTVAKACVKELAARIGKRSMTRLIQAL